MPRGKVPHSHYVQLLSDDLYSPVLGIYGEDEVAFAQRIASGRRRVECARV